MRDKDIIDWAADGYRIMVCITSIAIAVAVSIITDSLLIAAIVQVVFYRHEMRTFHDAHYYRMRFRLIKGGRS